METNFSDSLEIQKRLSFARNYNNWLFGQVQGYAHKRVLEAGCAIGNFTKKLIDREFVHAIDIEDGYIKAVREIFKDAANFKASKYDIASSCIRELKQDRFDTVICFNVLEHIENDSAALENMHYLLEKGGHLCLIVPAFRSIFGEMDKTDNHYRRYDKKILIEKIKITGFSIISAKYFNMPGFFGWWFNGKILRKRYIPFRQMMAYEKIIPLIRFTERFFNPPFGQSLVLIAKKND